MRWIGIDEAGYGPNLGPMVMTAVVAEGPGEARPDPWLDCAKTIGRAGSRGDLLWIDDSKRLYRSGVGLDRLDAAALAALAATGLDPLPTTYRALLSTLGIEPDRDAELSPWLSPGADLPVPEPSSAARVDAALRLQPFIGPSWRIVALRSILVGPSRFNRTLAATGSKALVHFDAFAELFLWAWDLSSDGTPTLIRSDKHGGRHFYADLLRSCLPPFSFTLLAGPEGPSLSRYHLTSTDPPRSLTLDLLPRADADDALVSLASILSKLLRERWMSCFNAHWTTLFPPLKPSAGYPIDASRFVRDLLALTPQPDPPVESWWRLK